LLAYCSQPRHTHSFLSTPCLTLASGLQGHANSDNARQLNTRAKDFSLFIDRQFIDTDGARFPHLVARTDSPFGYLFRFDRPGNRRDGGADLPSLGWSSDASEAWRWHSGHTPTSSTGPLQGVSGIGDGGYYYFEASGRSTGQTGWLRYDVDSPAADPHAECPHGIGTLKFAYHMSGSGMGELTVGHPAQPSREPRRLISLVCGLPSHL